MMPRIRFLLGILLLVSLQARGYADEAPKAVPEYSMKAAYLYNFAQLTSWPDELAPDGEFNLCIFGSDDFGSALKVLRRKTVDSRPIRVLHVTSAIEAQSCQMLFISGEDGVRNSRLLDTLRTSPVLTVSDDDRMANSGVMVLMRAEEQRLSFDVNLEVAKRSQLRLSSKLLKLAKKVTGGAE